MKKEIIPMNINLVPKSFKKMKEDWKQYIEACDNEMKLKLNDIVTLYNFFECLLSRPPEENYPRILLASLIATIELINSKN